MTTYFFFCLVLSCLVLSSLSFYLFLYRLSSSQSCDFYFHQHCWVSSSPHFFLSTLLHLCTPYSPRSSTRLLFRNRINSALGYNSNDIKPILSLSFSLSLSFYLSLSVSLSLPLSLSSSLFSFFFILLVGDEDTALQWLLRADVER